MEGKYIPVVLRVQSIELDKLVTPVGTDHIADYVIVGYLSAGGAFADHISARMSLPATCIILNGHAPFSVGYPTFLGGNSQSG